MINQTTELKTVLDTSQTPPAQLHTSGMTLPPAITTAASLPAGIIEHNKPLTSHDYVLTNPMDMKALDAILYQTICNIRQSMEPGARLFVLFGEDHFTATHIMAQAGALEALASHNNGADHGNLLYAKELPYNELQSYGNRHYGLPNITVETTPIHERDTMGHHFARAVMAEYNYNCATQSNSRIIAAALHHNIPMALVDAGQSHSKKHLDLSDDVAQKITSTLIENKNIGLAQISPKSNQGMIIRNAVMAARIANAANDHNADTSIISIGIDHLCGNMNTSLPYQTSLSAFLSASIGPQDRVLPVFFATKNDNYTPEDIAPPTMWEAHQQALIIRGASEEKYFSAAPRLEDKFITALGQSYGDDIPARFIPPQLPDKKEIRAQLHALASLDAA